MCVCVCVPQRHCWWCLLLYVSSCFLTLDYVSFISFLSFWVYIWFAELLLLVAADHSWSIDGTAFCCLLFFLSYSSFYTYDNNKNNKPLKKGLPNTTRTFMYHGGRLPTTTRSLDMKCKLFITITRCEDNLHPILAASSKL